MADSEHVDILRKGREAIEQWHTENADVGFDVSGADLSGADLRGANLSYANLIGADLSGADLSGADLRSADLSYADLINTQLIATDLSNAFLDGAVFTNAHMAGANFGNTDLSVAKGLEEVYQLGPSTIGIDTLYKSQGKIPESFLRGCGVPDGLIEFLPSLMGMQEAIQFYSCFISHSHKDENFCQRLHSRLRDEHLRVWYAPESMKGGEKIYEQIEQAIRVYDKLLLVLSETSMASEWVQTEIYHARQREVKEGKRVLFPIRLVSMATIREWKAFDSDTGRDMGREVREYFIPDFSNWKDHDEFEQAFASLLEDLRASGEKKA